MLLRALGAFALSCVCGTVSAGYGFDPVVALAPGAVSPRALAVGDITGDGRDDVVVLTGGTHPYYRDKVLIYAQRAGGGFSTPIALSYSNDAPDYARAIMLGDLDADADLDIVVLYDVQAQDTLALLRNDGGAFRINTVTTALSGTSIERMDVDDDGRQDILLTSDQSGYVGVLHGDGDGGIRDQVSFSLGTATDQFSLVDADNDGDRDLVYSPWPNDDRIMMRRHENGGFSAKPEVLMRSARDGARFAVADFTGDGRPDIALSIYDWSGSRLEVYPQSPDGTYHRSRVLNVAERPYLMRTHDMDGDGRQDMLAPRSSVGAVGVYFGRPQGLSPARSFVTDFLEHMAVGDLNDDGLGDFALAQGQGGVALLLSRAAPLENDLGVYIGLMPNAMAARVENRGALSSGTYNLSLRITARTGSLSLGSLPKDCYNYSWDGSAHIECYNLPALPAGAHRVFAIPFTLPAGSNIISATAKLGTYQDLRDDNNAAMKRITISPAAPVAARRPRK